MRVNKPSAGRWIFYVAAGSHRVDSRQDQPLHLVRSGAAGRSWPPTVGARALILLVSKFVVCLDILLQCNV